MTAEANSSKTFVCRKQDLENGRICQIRVGLKPVMVAKTGNDIVAFEAHCKHMGANLAVSGKRNADILTCAWHGWAYNLNSGVCHGKSGVALTRYSVEVCGEEVFLILG